MSLLLTIALTCNTVWFGLAFWSFYIRSHKYAGLVVNKSRVDKKTYEIISTTINFLGGINLPISLLSVYILYDKTLFPETKQLTVLLVFFAASHFSQFISNVPVAMNEARGRPHLWPVLSGDMLPIFVLDGVFTLLNLSAVAFLPL